MTVSRCIFVLGWLKTWGQWHPVPSTQCPLLAWSGTVEFVSLFVSFYEIAPSFYGSPSNPIATRRARQLVCVCLKRQRHRLEKHNEWGENKEVANSVSRFWKRVALAGDQSYALRPNLSAASVCESPQIPILKNVGLEAKLIRNCKIKIKKMLLFSFLF